MPTARAKAFVGFALQGGGAHGAFTGATLGWMLPIRGTGLDTTPSYDIDRLLKNV